ncbi:ferritin-like domain-containing protein [Chitinophaga sp.]|uniref:ferritin-like domain-containing protein n=1 Tax=Chitinophaga sp. TaxID=1869181 RepID=UPI002B566614|nr:ferritin-like domain-containing protein [Chitinophaga sp.]HWV65036.1 ferritin-like domain-containing protein [Chitinophaga sp.]
MSLGSGDVAVLNYAYALEQLEAAFYTQVVLTPYTGIGGRSQCRRFPNLLP